MAACVGSETVRLRFMAPAAAVRRTEASRPRRSAGDDARDNTGDDAVLERLVVLSEAPLAVKHD